MRALVFNRNVAPVFLFAAAWVLAIVLVNPFGNFPIVDDWAYAGSVRDLLQHGQFHLSDWTAPNQISLIAWGAIFGSVFGTSYTALRFSTLVLAFVGAIALYKILRRENVAAPVAAIAALTVLFAQYPLQYSFSFMTDVPYTTAQTVAMLFLMRGSAQPLGWFAACIALLCRQIGLAIPIAWGCTYLVKHGITAKRLMLAALPPAAFIGVQVLYQVWLAKSGLEPIAFGAPIGMNASPTVMEVIGHTISSMIPITKALAIASLPILILAFSKRLRFTLSEPVIFSGVVFILLCGLLGIAGMPFGRYMIPMLPCVAIILCVGLASERTPNWAIWVSASILAFMASINIARTHDQLSEMRVRMAALQRLTVEGVPRENIDAQWEMNGADNFGRYGDPRDQSSWFETPEYTIGYRRNPRYHIIARYNVPTYNPFKSSEELVQKLSNELAQKR